MRFKHVLLLLITLVSYVYSDISPYIAPGVGFSVNKHGVVFITKVSVGFHTIPDSENYGNFASLFFNNVTFSKHAQLGINKEFANYKFIEMEAGASILKEKLLVGVGVGIARHGYRDGVSKWLKLSGFAGNFGLFARADYVYQGNNHGLLSTGVQATLPYSYWGLQLLGLGKLGDHYGDNYQQL